MPDDPICEAPVGPDETCQNVASWIVTVETGEMKLCQEHNDYDLQHNPEPGERRGVWEDFENAETLEDVNRKKFVPPALTLADFSGRVIQWIGQGWPEGLLIKLAIVSMNAYMAATDRWAKLEYGRDRTAPLWLDEREAAKLAAMLRGLKGAEARAIRQTIEELFND